MKVKRGTWLLVLAALTVGAFIGNGGGFDVFAQATPGVTETAPPGTETAIPGTETPVPATETVPPATETVAPATETAPPDDETPAVGGQTPVAGAPAAGGRLTITVVERAINDTPIDLGDPGDSIGDLIAFGNPVFDEDNEQQVGQGQGSCVRTVVGASYECSFTVILPDGQLAVQGPFEDDGESVLAITGGTGAYAGASGEMGLSVFEDPETPNEEYLFVFSIIEASLSPA